MAAKTYSFMDVQAAIAGPNGSFSMGNGAGPAEEGITISWTDDIGTLTMGADGSGMHSLHAARNGTVTIRLLKTSPLNHQLMTMYNSDTSSGANYGNNTISVRDPIRGDTITASYCGFKKAPDITFAKEGGMNEWAWNAAQIEASLGNGNPSLI